MQGAKKAGESIKETAANVGASAQAGMEKTKATVQEKAERMTARDPLQKEMATQKKEERLNQAEMQKQAAREHNAATKHSATGGNMGLGQHTTTGPATGTTTTYTHSTGQGQPTGAHQMSDMPAGHVVEGVVGSHPIGTNTGTGRASTAHNTRVGGNPNDPGYGTGGSYT